MTEPFRQQLGLRLRDLREERGWSQWDLAQRAGVRPQTISAIERGERGGSEESRSRIASALGVAVGVLVYGEAGAA